MPMQQQASSFLARLGGRIAAANVEHRGKPVDTGNRRLPGGIRHGVAQISALYTKVQDKKDGTTPEGETFFRASAIVKGHMENGVLCEGFKGEKISGMVIQKIIPICDLPPTEWRPEGTSLSQNWDDLQNFFKLLGFYPPDGHEGRPDYNTTNDPQSEKLWNYYQAGMTALAGTPERPPAKPVYISFSTESWTPKKKPTDKEEPKERVMEKWHGVTAAPPPPVPGAGMRDGTSNGPPPTPTGHGVSSLSGPLVKYEPSPTKLDVSQPSESEIAELVDICMNDPDGATDEGTDAAARLEALAWANGWTKDQTKNAADWAAIGEMAFAKPNADGFPSNDAEPESDQTKGPLVGSRWLFKKRSKEGVPLKNKKGEEFPGAEVEVTAVATDGTCTVKTKDGREMQNLHTKQAVAVKFEWLEPLPY